MRFVSAITDVAGFVCRLALCSVLLVMAVASPASAAVTGPVIVLIGGPDQGYPKGEHDYIDGTLKIERLIKYSPQLQAVNAVVKTFPLGFPKDLAQIADADVVLLYCGLDYASGKGHQLEDPAALKAVATLMAKGAGLIALHQASTVTNKDSPIPFKDWLGAIRIGFADRTTEIARMEIAGGAHPIARGLSDFELLDEFYPTVDFSTTTKVTPILTAKVHVEYRDKAPVFEDPAKSHVLAWAAERPNGGRSFGFTGVHYLTTLDQPQIRTVLLNAILWTAKRDVPATGSNSNALPLALGALPSAGPREDLRAVLPKAEVKVEPQSWGKLEWFASRALGNSTSITVGRATILPGQANPLHRHPNTDEVLHLVQGRIEQRVGDKDYEMNAGDTVVIPKGILHNARNIGTEDAVMLISYPTADRITVGE